MKYCYSIQCDVICKLVNIVLLLSPFIASKFKIKLFKYNYNQLFGLKVKMFSFTTYLFIKYIKI